MEEKNLDPRPRTGRKELTPRNRVFLEKLADCLPVVDAYRLAGYTGAPHTAHELKRQLKAELKEVLEARGHTLEGVAAEVLALSRLPLDMARYQHGVTLEQKLKILKLHAEILKQGAPAHSAPVQNVTAFIVNRSGQGAQVSVNQDRPIDTTASDGTETKE